MNLSFIVLPLALCIVLAACGGGGYPSPAPAPAREPVQQIPVTPPDTNLPLRDRAPTSAELAQVQATWAQRNLSSQDVVTAYESSEGAYNLKIYSHKVGGNTHFGVVLVPISPISRQLPVLLYLDGLGPEPLIDLETHLSNFRPDAVLVMPLFRGRIMRFRGHTFQATGDFCDSWDGAADDAISLLNVVAATTPQADANNVTASGYSRGGTIALLVGERDRRVRTIIAGAAPTDFNREEMRVAGGRFYQCQFVTDMTAAASRQRILASSPLHFPILPSVRKVNLFQGETDTAVRPWHTRELVTALAAQAISPNVHFYPGAHGTTPDDPNFKVDWKAAHDEALRLGTTP